MLRVIVISSVLFLMAGFASADGLDTLIDVGRSQGEIARAYSEETRAYEGVKRAAESGHIIKGISKKSIIDKYGEPVVAVREYGTDREKCIYKPASSDFGSGPKVSLYFTKDGILDEIAVGK